jgi:hypothetical protein
MQTREDQEIAKDNRYLVRMWVEEERDAQRTHAPLERVFDALTTEGETPRTNSIIQWYMKLRPNGIVRGFEDVDVDMEIHARYGSFWWGALTTGYPNSARVCEVPRIYVSIATG